jgi:tetratricopeptide (TPR) repeat protein
VVNPLVQGGRIVSELFFDLSSEFSEYFQARQYDEALSVAEFEVERYPTESGAYFDRGLALSNFQRHSEALSDFERATTLDPQKSLYQYHVAQQLRSLRRYDEALAACEQVLRIALREAVDRDAQVWNLKWEIFLELGRRREAEDARKRLELYRRK